MTRFALQKGLPGCGDGTEEGGQVWKGADHWRSGAITQKLHDDNINWSVVWDWGNMRHFKEAESNLQDLMLKVKD